MRTCVKICGLTRLEDAVAAADAGADFLGFIQVPGTPRYLAPDRLAELRSQLPGNVLTVGVFVDAPLDMVRRIVECCRLDIVQLNGTEDPDYVNAVGAERVWLARHLRTPQDVDHALACPGEAIVADTMVPGQRGGTGITGDWALAARLAGQRSVVLAGGLTPVNVAEAVLTVRPFAVDVSSGVEVAKGVKDHDELRAFVAAVRSVKPE